VFYLVTELVEIVGDIAIETGSWADLETAAGYAIPITLKVSGQATVAGLGGDGGAAPNYDGTSGKPCVNMSHNLTVEVYDDGALGGGGGGGAGELLEIDDGVFRAAGGGGGGGLGFGGGGVYRGKDGGVRSGGEGGSINIAQSAGDGGFLGSNGQSTPGGFGGVGGAAGAAIIQNGFTLTLPNGTTQIYGAII
jgi:hypothetical protein